MKPFDDRDWWRQQVPPGGCALATLARRARVSPTLATAVVIQAQERGWIRTSGKSDVWVTLTDSQEAVDTEADGERVLAELVAGNLRAWVAVQQDSGLSPDRFDAAVRELRRRGAVSVLGTPMARTLQRTPTDAADDAAILAALDAGAWRSMTELEEATGLHRARCIQSRDRLLQQGRLRSRRSADGMVYLQTSAPSASTPSASGPSAPPPSVAPFSKPTLHRQSPPTARLEPTSASLPARPAPTRPEPASLPPRPAASPPPTPRPEPALPSESGWRPAAGTVAPGEGAPRFLDLLPARIALR